jgi:hypothetical protein
MVHRPKDDLLVEIYERRTEAGCVNEVRGIKSAHVLMRRMMRWHCKQSTEILRFAQDDSVKVCCKVSQTNLAESRMVFFFAVHSRLEARHPRQMFAGCAAEPEDK